MKKSKSQEIQIKQFSLLLDHYEKLFNQSYDLFDAIHSSGYRDYDENKLINYKQFCRIERKAFTRMNRRYSAYQQLCKTIYHRDLL